MIADIERPASTHVRAPRHRWPWAAGGAAAIIAAATLLATDPFGTPAAPASSGNTAAVTYGTVLGGPLSAQVQENGTLGFAGTYTVAGQAGGVYTALPQPGQLITAGQQLYQVSGTPVILLYGTVPAYRQLSQGDSGADVAELNDDLAALGYGGSRGSGQFTAATAGAVQGLQAHYGLSQTGTLSLGSVIVEPGAIRVTSVTASLGGQAAPGATVMQASSTTRQVVVNLDAAQQSQVRPGDKVTITLPTSLSTPGTVSSVGTVATPATSGSSSSGSGSAPAATVQVDIRPDDPAATGTIDQAPVQVTITSQTIPHALAVPVTALLATASGGYAVEVAPGRPLVPVTLGIFDDAAGLVQVTGNLHPGERIAEALT